MNKLEALFHHEPYLRDLVNKEGLTLPWICAQNNHTQGMLLFIKENFDCNEIINSSTVFHKAAECGSLDVLKVLLEYKPDALKLKNRGGDTLLHTACFNDKVEVVQFLLQPHLNVELNVTNKFACSPLHYACEENRIQVVELLLMQPGIDVNVRHKYGDTPLHKACRNNHVKVVSMLIKQKNIDVNIRNKNKQYADDLTEDRNIKRMINKITQTKPRDQDKEWQSTLTFNFIVIHRFNSYVLPMIVDY